MVSINFLDNLILVFKYNRSHVKLEFFNHNQYNVGRNLLSDFYMTKAGIISFVYLKISTSL